MKSWDRGYHSSLHTPPGGGGVSGDDLDLRENHLDLREIGFFLEKHLDLREITWILVPAFGEILSKNPIRIQVSNR